MHLVFLPLLHFAIKTCIILHEKQVTFPLSVAVAQLQITPVSYHLNSRAIVAAVVFSVRIGYLRLSAAFVHSIRVSVLVAAVRRCTSFRHVTTKLVLVVKYSLPRLHHSPHYRANQRNHIADHRRYSRQLLLAFYSSAFVFSPTVSVDRP